MRSGSNAGTRGDGEPLALQGVPQQQSVEDWSTFDPEAAPADAVGHYLESGALWRTDMTQAPGPAGAGAYQLRSAAVSADARTGQLSSMAGVTVQGGSARTTSPTSRTPTTCCVRWRSPSGRS